MDSRQADILAQLYQSPAFYIRGLDEGSRQLVLHHMSRSAYQDSSFLNKHLVGDDDLFDLLPLQETIHHHQTAAPPPKPVHFIFHFAFCGSTLLGRGLDFPGYTMVYKEPYILHQVSHFLRFPSLHNLPAEALLSLSLSAVQRTFSPSETPIVKVTDSCANLVESCLNRHHQSTGIVLYNTLDTFLLATLKAPERRRFIRSHIFRAAYDLKSAGIELTFKPDQLSDAELSGYIWFSLMHRYQALLQNPELSLKSLSMDRLTQEPTAVLKLLNTFMALNIPDSELEQMVTEGAFSTDSKFPDRTFDQQAYQLRQERYRIQVADEIQAGKDLVMQLKQQFPFNHELPQAL